MQKHEIYLMMTKFTLCFFLFARSTFGFTYPTPNHYLAPGESIWPRPVDSHFTEEFITLSKNDIKLTSNDCPSVKHAFDGFIKNLPETEKLHFHPQIEIQLLFNDCPETPDSDMEEWYTIEVMKGTIVIEASQSWGIIHGFTSLEQMVWRSTTKSDNNLVQNSINLNISKIMDTPRLKYRGVLLDTSRHYLPIPTIKRQLELMRINKLNVFHWHIVDDPSFPYKSEILPKLTNPFKPEMIYTIKSVKQIINFAALRGIRVIPEFDTPGHVKSWENVDENFLTKCGDESKGTFGSPIDVSNPNNYELVNQLYSELRQVFRDEFVHLGGDEVSFNCWKSNENITQFMAANDLETYEQLESFYIEKLLKIADSNKFKSIVWEEVFFNDEKLDKEVLVHVWKPRSWKETVKKVSAKGYHYILSGPWYLNYISYGEDYRNYYKVHIPKDNKLYGGEMCMWGEFVDETNLESRLWPRGSAVAEKFWSADTATSSFDDETRARLDRMRCFMVGQGFNAEPLFPGYC